MLYPNILAFIGRTPLVQINRLNPYSGVALYAKLEGQNPGGSIKDRAAMNMVLAAEKTGALTPDKTILEATSGNTGIGLALVGAVRGYAVTLTMSAAMSQERKKMLKAFGTRLIETNPRQGTDGAIRQARELFRKNPEKYWRPDQFKNPDHPRVHAEITAPEIIQDLPDLNYLVAGLGTSGTLMGLGQTLKSYNPTIQIIGVEPRRQAPIAGLKNMRENIVPPIYQPEKLDQKIHVSPVEAQKTARALARQEGIFVGESSGAALAGALKIAAKISTRHSSKRRRGVQKKAPRAAKTKKIVVIFPDRGEKYLSTGLFSV